MVVGNTLSEIGDVLIVDTQLSIMGTYLQLVTYTEVTIGETATRIFDKKFRVSQDGLIYTEWYDLSIPNIAAIQGSIINNNIFIQYRYERVGTDSTGLLEFVSINVTGNVVPTVCTTPTINNSIFKGLGCGNFVTAQLCSNLLKKLYTTGIVPEYITRGVVQEDTDYISFWSAVACYMSMFVTFARKFETIEMDRNLLIEYLKQLNIHFCEHYTTLEDLQYIAEHYLNEIYKRGTKTLFMRKGELLQNGNDMLLDGEILRLLCIKPCDEFMWTLKALEHTGWKVGQSSPMYKGTQFDDNLIKGFEKTADCLDLSKYTLFGSSNISNTTQTTIDCVSSTLFKVGFGFEDFINELDVHDKGIVVDPKIDYEITFKVKVNSVANNPRINFKCHVFDCLNNKYSLAAIDTGLTADTFDSHINIHKANTYYFIRGIVYSKQHQLITTVERHLNTSTGVNLKFNDDNITRLMPYIEIQSDVDGDIFNIYDFKIRPLRYSHSYCFINTFNVVEIFAENKNAKYTFSQIYDIIRRDLIPYNTVLFWNNYLSKT